MLRDDIYNAPFNCPFVTVEWLDITSHPTGLEPAQRWTDGRLLSLDYKSEQGVQCVVLGRTRDEDGWTDFDIFPAGSVLNMQELADIALGAGEDEDDDDTV